MFLCTASVPNIVLYLADDLGVGEINQQSPEWSWAPSSKTYKRVRAANRIQTPTLEQMAKEGKRFLRSYASSSVCGPSRHSILTGIQVGNNTVRGMGQNKGDDDSSDDDLMTGRTTIAQVLQNGAGYSTLAVGKWGVTSEYNSSGSPCKNGFDSFFGYFKHADAGSSFPTVIRSCNKFDPDNIGETLYPENEDASQEKCLNTGVCTFSEREFRKTALDFVATAVTPFFLYWATTAPHSAFFENDLVKQQNCIEKTHPVPDFGPYSVSRLTNANIVKAGHKAMVTLTIDKDMEFLLAALRVRGIENDTLIVFASDNGAHKAAYSDRRYDPNRYFTAGAGMQGIKRGMYEGSLRSPTLFWYPSVIPPGSSSTFPTMHYDLALTLAQFAEIDSESAVLDPLKTERAGGVSIYDVCVSTSDKSLVKSGKTPSRMWIYSELCHMRGGRVRKGRRCPNPWSPVAGCVWAVYQVNTWPKVVLKMMKQYPNDRPRLYNVLADPLERRNLGRSSRYRKVLTKLQGFRDEARTTFCSPAFNEPTCVIN